MPGLIELCYVNLCKDCKCKTCGKWFYETESDEIENFLKSEKPEIEARKCMEKHESSNNQNIIEINIKY